MPVGYFLKDAGLTDSTATLARSGEYFEPTIADSLKAGFEAGMNAEGSLSDDINAYNINREIGQEPTFLQKTSKLLASPWTKDVEAGTPLTEEQYLASPAYREGLKYLPGLTTTAAQIRAQEFDADKRRGQIYQQGGAVGTAGFFVASLAGATADAKNLAAGGAAALAVSALSPLVAAPVGAVVAAGSAVKNVARTAWRGITAGRVATIATEATLGSLPSVISGIQNSKVTAREYDVGDAFLDLTAASIFSVGLDVGAGYAKDLYRRRFSVADKEALNNLAVSQYANGETVHIAPLVEAGLAKYTPDYMTTEVDLPVIAQLNDAGKYEARFDSADPELAALRLEADDPDVAISTFRDRNGVQAFSRKTEVVEVRPGEFEAKVAGERGVTAAARGVGKTKEEAVSDLFSVLTDTDMTRLSSQVGVSQDVLRAIREAQQARLAYKNFNPEVETRQVAKELGLDIKKLDTATKKVELAEARVAKADAALKERAETPARLREQVNANEALIRAKAQLDSLKSNEFGGLAQALDARRNTLRDRYTNAERVARQVQGDAVRPRLERFVQEQSRGRIPPKDMPDDLVRSIDQDAVARDAARAPQEDAEIDFRADGTRAYQQITEIVRGEVIEPPVPAGMVRVYHSGTVGEGKSGRWVSSNKGYAEGYRSDQPLYYLDLRADDPRLTSDVPDQGVKEGFTFNFELKPDEATQLKALTNPNTIVDAQTRTDLTEALKSIDNSRERSEQLRAFLKCRGS